LAPIRTTCPTHPPWHIHSNYTWQRMQVMKLFIMQFSPNSRHFISLRSIYFSQNTFLKHPKFMFLTWCQRQSFKTIQNHWQNYGF
jgi:hypothetical protein